jgi:excisionase family DNA binding protein
VSDRLEVAVRELVDALREELRLERQAGPPPLLSVDQAAERLGVSRTSMYGMIRRGELRTIRVGRRRLVPESAIADVVEDGGRSSSGDLGR